jgi:II/X family phage/plasmid replication protein
VIDWLDLRAPLVHDVSRGGPLYGGEVRSIDDEGVIEWSIGKRMQVEGSHSTKISVRSSQMTLPCGRIWPAIRISGNPAKWFQGHNIFGTEDMLGLVRETLLRVCASRGIVPSAHELDMWRSGWIELLRVDATRSYDLGSRSRVQNALRSLDQTAHLKFRGRGSYNGNSLLFGKGSRHWSLTLYAKGPELEKHRLPDELAGTSLVAHAQGLLRAEVRMLSQHLTRSGLKWVYSWTDNTVEEQHRLHMEQLSISDAAMLDPEALDTLAPRLRMSYQLWKDGHDLRTILTRPTFYRHRAELLEHGIDLAVKQDRAADSNVVPLRVVLLAAPVGVPDWAEGTKLYFEPRRAA